MEKQAEKSKQETHTIRINPKLWKEIKVYVARNDLTISYFLELASLEKLEKEKFK